jgi:hypothetical protein
MPFVQRTITIRIQDDPDLRDTLKAFMDVQNKVAPEAYNGGDLISAVELHRRSYQNAKGVLSSQMTQTAMRLVVGNHASARANWKRRLKQEAKRKVKHIARVGPTSPARSRSPACPCSNAPPPCS